MKTNLKRILLYIVIGIAPMSIYAETLQIYGGNNGKPKIWKDESGHSNGILVDLLDEITLRTDIKFNITLSPWNRSLQLSKSGNGAIVGFSKTTEREVIWDYSQVMYFDDVVFISLKSNQFDYSGIESLAGKKIALKRGAIFGEEFHSAQERKIFEVVHGDNREDLLRLLILGRVDAVLESQGQFAYVDAMQNHSWLLEHRDDFVIIQPPFKRDPNYIGIPKAMNKSHLIKPINQALEAIHKDGTYLQIMEKYMSNLN